MSQADPLGANAWGFAEEQGKLYLSGKSKRATGKKFRRRGFLMGAEGGFGALVFRPDPQGFEEDPRDIGAAVPLLALDLGIATPGGTGAGLRPFAGVAKVKGATAGYYVLEFYTRRFFAQHFYAGPGIAIGKVFADYVPQFSDSGFTYRIDLGREFPMARHFALGIEGVHLGMLGKNGRYFIFGIQLSPRIYLN